MKTKIFFLIASIFLLVILFSFCEKSELISEPVLTGFTASSNTITSGEEVIFTVEGKADLYVIWTGDEKHNFEERGIDAADLAQLDLNSTESYNPTNTGNYISDLIYSYKYTKPGIYTCVIILTNIGKFSDEVKQKIAKVQITVLPAEK